MNTYEWLYTSLKDTTIPKEDVLNELYHRVQLEELPLIIYKAQKKWRVSLDERHIGKHTFAGFHFAKEFMYAEQATKWARTQFGTGGDIKVSYFGPLTLTKE